MEPSENSITLSDIFIPSDKVIARDIEGEIIIVPIEDGVADFNDALYSLNETGREIWEQLSRENTLEMICRKLSDEYQTSMETLRDDVLELAGKLFEMNIIKKIDG